MVTEPLAARHLELLQEAQQIARIGSWERDLRTNELWWSDECFRLFGYKPNSIRPSYSLFLQRIHPEDREQVSAIVIETLAKKIEHDIEYRVLMPRGEIRYFHQQGRVFLDDDGNAIRTGGTTQDITERKLQEQLRQRADENLRLADSVFKHSPVAIVIADGDKQILSVNPAFAHISGFSAEDVLKQPLDCLPIYPPMSNHPDVLEALQRNGHWSGEVTNQRKDGVIHTLWLHITRVSSQRTGYSCFDNTEHAHYIWMMLDITERKQAEARIHHLAHHDPLTGLPNRLSLRAKLEEYLPVAERYNMKLAIMFIDLDRFKVINDTLGHQFGDQLLSEVANRLVKTVRSTDTVVRLGGDEFVVLLPYIQTHNDAAEVATKIIEQVGEPIRIDNQELHTSPSIGISLYPEDGQDVDTMLRNADTAMYHAKAEGRNNFQFYAEALNQAASERLHLERKLRNALIRGEFSLCYQPQSSVSRRSPTGVEALLRWTPIDEGPISPVRFVPIAEETGLIVPIGEWVLRTACHEVKRWLDAGLAPVRVAVNLSAHQLRQKNFLDVVASALSDSGLPPHLLELEITESAVMEQPKEAIKILSALRVMGLSLAIDDFGTGYSSLAYLKLFPIDHLKIDRSFVADIEHDLDDRAIAFGTIALAHSLGLNVIAEGVETQEQLDLLSSQQCDEVQGYLFAKPLTPSAAFDYLRQRQQIAGLLDAGSVVAVA